jgi:transposase
MALKRRLFTREFKLQVLREIQAGKSVAQASREHQLHPTLISKW